MATFTRAQLSNKATHSSDFTGASTFTLINNASTTAYSNIEGGNKDIFNSASLTSLVNCSVVTESIHAGLIIAPNGKRDGFANMSGSVDTSVNGIKDSLTGAFSGSAGTYTGVSASNANVTASLYLIESTSLGTVTVTSQGQEFSTGDTVIFPSQSFGATTADGEDMTFTLKSSNIVSNGTASLTFTSTSTISKDLVLFSAANRKIISGSTATYYGVDLTIT